MPGAARRSGCSYKKDVCSIHGPGAKLRWRPNGTKTTLPDGKTESGRDYFRVCDLGSKGRKMIQPSITSAMTPGRRQEDTSSNIYDISFVTPSVGQNTSVAQIDRVAGIKPDEVGQD